MILATLAGCLAIGGAAMGASASDNNTVSSRAAVYADPTADPSPAEFGNQGDGTASPAHVITITNHGVSRTFGSDDPRISPNKASLTGNDSEYFFISQDNCDGATIVAEATCTIHVRFFPGATRSYNATLNEPYAHIEYIGDGRKTADGTLTVPLHGTGTDLNKGDTGPTGPTGPTGHTGQTGPTGPSGGGKPQSEKFVICRRDTRRRDRAVLCTVRYNNHGHPVVTASLSSKGHTYASGTARKGKALRLKAFRHMSEGHYKLARTYNGRTTYFDTVRVLIIR